MIKGWKKMLDFLEQSSTLKVLARVMFHHLLTLSPKGCHSSKNSSWGFVASVTHFCSSHGSMWLWHMQPDSKVCGWILWHLSLSPNAASVKQTVFWVPSQEEEALMGNGPLLFLCQWNQDIKSEALFLSNDNLHRLLSLKPNAYVS